MCRLRFRQSLGMVDNGRRRIRNHLLLRAGRGFRRSCLFYKRLRYKKKRTDDTPDQIGLMGKMAHVIRGLSIPRSGTYTITASPILQLANTLSMRMVGDRAGFGSRWVAFARFAGLTLPFYLLPGS